MNRSIFFFAIAFIFSTSALAVDVIAFDQREDMAAVIRMRCPWASAGHAVQRVDVAGGGAKEIGNMGGAVGEKLNDLLGGNAAAVNATEISADGFDPAVRVIVLESGYFDTHDGGTVLEFSKLRITRIDGSTEEKGLVKAEQAGYQSIMLCFGKDEQPFRVSATVVARDAYGSRPTVGVAAYLNAPEMIPAQ